ESMTWWLRGQPLQLTTLRWPATTLGWPNAFPLGDYVLRKRLADHDGTLPTRHAMATRAEDWAPWRAYAAMHLWHRDDALAPTP
ncbi:hypothetical protein ACQUWS_13110, partial [Ralstonia pseudosolanacearum]